MKKLLFALTTLFCSLASNAQIGYQVSLLNSATGEPRSNETVECEVTLLDSEGTVICSETKKAVSNDFGVISLSVGNANTFDYVDWSKLPFFVEVSVGGSLIGRSQILTVPVAEHAKHYGTLTYENILEKKIVCFTPFVDEDIEYHFSFHSDKTVTWRVNGYSHEGFYRIAGNIVFVDFSVNAEGSIAKVPFFGFYSLEDDILYITGF